MILHRIAWASALFVCWWLAGTAHGQSSSPLRAGDLPRPGRPSPEMRESADRPQLKPEVEESASGDAKDAKGDSKEDEKEDEDKKDDEPSGLFGKKLHGRNGVSAEYVYTGDTFCNTRGGLRVHDATSYRGLMEVMLKADLKEMHFAPGGNFFLLGQQGHGPGFTRRYVGDFQWFDNIDAPDFTQVSEYWYERGFFDSHLRLRMGKQDCNADFAIVDLGGDFINSSFGFAPTIPMPSYPNPSMGASAVATLREGLDLKVGVWDGFPDGGSWGFSGTGVTFTIGEVKWKYDLAEKKGLPGDIHVGIWYHSGNWEDLRRGGENSIGSIGASLVRTARYYGLGTALHQRGVEGTLGDSNVLSGNHGFYFGADQLIFKERRDDEKDAQGMGVFVQYGSAPQERNWVSQYVGGGLVYRGLLPSRDEDLFGVGVAHAVFSGNLGATEDETAIELYYKAKLKRWMSLQPDMQYLVNPGGTLRDALVVGTRFEVVF